MSALERFVFVLVCAALVIGSWWLVVHLGLPVAVCM